MVAFDRSSTKVFRLIPSTGQFDYEPDWSDSILFREWEENSNWREIVSNLMGEINPTVLQKLRQFSHFHFRLLEAIHDWPGFVHLLNVNPFLAVCLAGRIRVGAQREKRRSQLDYGSLVLRSERDIAATLGFGDSDEVVKIMRKLPADACKPYVFANVFNLLQNPITTEVLSNAEVISYPALTLLNDPYLAPNLTASFLSEFAETFPTQLDIVCCPWGTLLRGGGKGDDFTWVYQQALDVVEADPNAIIYSLEDLGVRHCLLGWANGR
jgi:hypothetical protein